MIYGSVCSGVAPQTQAWSELGWKCAWFAEIEPFPSAVLQYRFPETPNLGDFTKIDEHTSGPINVLVGGTPCQSFSVAGKRAGLDDPRGNLTIEFARLAQRLRPRWLVWENVPGVLSIDNGRTFGAFLGILGELGYGVAYRVLDAQYFGVAQRRRRVFVVGHLGDWRRAAAVLFERESLSGNPAPSREKGQRVASSTEDSSVECGGFYESSGTHSPCFGDTSPTLGAQKKVCLANSVPELARCLSTSNERIGTFQSTGQGWWNESDVAQSVRTDGARHIEQNIVAFSAKDHGADASVYGFSAGQSAEAGTIAWQPEQSPTLRGAASGTNQVPAVAFTCSEQANGFAWERDVYPTISAQQPSDTSNIQMGIRQGMAVRRLTPRECERLQGMSDDWTLIPISKRNKKAELKEMQRYDSVVGNEISQKWSADGPRYKAIGNSWAVPVLTWIAKRINRVETR